jgi:hypothetical protein
MSSDSTGAVGDTAASAEQVTGAAASSGGPAGPGPDDRADLADPWFAPGPKVDTTDLDGDAAGADAAGAVAAAADAAYPDTDGADTGGPGAGSAEAAGAESAGAEAAGAEAVNASLANGHAAVQAEWFLRTGRAGLLPDSMTVDSADDASASHRERVQAAGAPPWTADTADALASAPPPWETGPWPGPGALAGAQAGVEEGQPDSPGAAANGVRAAGEAARGAASLAAHPAAPDPAARGVSPAAGSRWSARTVLTAGLIPLVVPGLVLGILGLRQPAQPVRRASWLAIGASVAWAVIIVLIIAGTVGGSAAACGGYPAAVQQAYGKAMADVRGHAPAAVQAADLETAASRANASAAAAGQIEVRTALFAMANDTAQARADIMAHRPIPAALRQHLVTDGAEPAGSCAS